MPRGRGKYRGKRGAGESSRSNLPPHLKHPKHLKGRDIGLWYSKKSQEKNGTKKIEPQILGNVIIPPGRAEKINNFLSKLPQRKSSQKETSDAETSYIDDIPDSDFKSKFLANISTGIMEKLETIKEIKPDERADEIFKSELENKQSNHLYRRFVAQRQRLPAHKLKEDILKAVNENQVVIISGETGCGKTTQVPQFILEDCVANGKGSTCRIICSQPRRISAISVAERVAEERGEPLGETVGFKIRLESKEPRSRGSIIFCTTGIIIKMLESNVGLEGYSHLILDEVHERDILTDFILAIVKCILRKNKTLKVILMSATLNAVKFAQYFDVESIITIPGFTYEVQEFYLEDALLRTGFKFPDKNARGRYRSTDPEFYTMIGPHVRNLEASNRYPKSVCRELMKEASEESVLELALRLIIDICRKEEDSGAILVFLTGYMDIAKLNSLMTESGEFPGNKYLILPLHSQMPTVHQKCIFDPPPAGVRKIILSTNISETSITINDVVFVIDCGKIKITKYDAETNEESLKPQWVSLANAQQRKGRAGRVKPGICYHLYSQARKMLLDQYLKPELLRSRLENVILNLKFLQLGAADRFLATCLDPPSEESVQKSVDFLKRLDALDEQERLTPLGYHLARLPVPPQIGKMMLLGCFFSCLDPVLNVAATLSHKDAFLMPLGKEVLVNKRKVELSEGQKSDHLLMSNVIGQFELAENKGDFCWRNFLSQQILVQLLKMKQQFADILRDLRFLECGEPKQRKANANSHNVGLLKAIICASLYPNVFLNTTKVRNVRHSRPRFHTIERKRVELHPKSIINAVLYFETPCLVYYLKVRSTGDFVHDASIVNMIPLVIFGDRVKVFQKDGEHLISVNDYIRFKSDRKSVVIVVELRKRFNEFLLEKVANPQSVDWEQEDQVTVLKSIQELITFEEEGFNYEDFVEGLKVEEDFTADVS